MEDAPATNPNDAIIAQFSNITSASTQEATFYLESHNYDLDSALSTFFEATAADDADAGEHALPVNTHSPVSSSPSRSRSISPPPSLGLQQMDGANPYNLRSRNTAAEKKASGSRSSGRIRTFSDLNRTGGDSGSDSDEPQEYYTGGEKSGMLVQDPRKMNDVESLFNQARQAGAEERPLDQFQPSSSSRSFAGRGRLLSGETTSAPPQQPEPLTHTITFWTNGFTVNDGPLRRLDDPQNASFLESIRKSECPEELKSATGRAPDHVSLVRKLEEYPVQKHRQAAFVGVGRTLGSTTSEDATAAIPAPATAAPTPFVGLVVDNTLPSTSIQLRLADGTRMVSRFNFHHTISNIRSFIDASRPGGPRAYQLLTMGFPPKQLNDLNQTIEEAGLANSVVIQKL
ncbi:putative UBX domain, UBA-like superfamily, SEP domain, Ubiquitin-like domain superfamily [Helianthus annuus]|nr:putative UBX domain, UBA-like superfamily, SEP domain, Ubiquitin-like domain superfamily [Helianthus annuus]